MSKKLYSFDFEFYKNTYTDLERFDITTKEQCLSHYLHFGKKEGRCCNKDEMQIKYKKNRENAISKIDNFVNNCDKFINILIRTSNRPEYFEKCIQSILDQTYKEYHVYVCYDCEESLSYLKKYEEHKQVTYFYVNEDSQEKYKFNLYCNKLLDKVSNDYIMFIDDDDNFLHKSSLHVINSYLQNYKLITWNFLRPDQLIYKKNMDESLQLGDIDTACVCFHNDLKKHSSWSDKQYGDFNFYTPIFDICKSEEKDYINYTLTGTQFDNKIGNYGKNEIDT